MPRPLTRWFCRWRPRRTADRSFSVNDAARIACKVITSGKGTLRTITARIEEKCPSAKPERNLQDVDAAAEAAAVIQQNTIYLEDAYTAFLVVNGILIGLAALARLLPGPLRLVAPAAAAARVNVASLLQRNITQRAANDAMFEQLNLIQQLLRRAA